MFQNDENHLVRQIGEAIERATGVSVWPDPPPIKQWAPLIETLSAVYTRVGGVKSVYREEHLVDAYCIYFFPANVLRLINFFSSLAEESADEIDKILSKDKIVFWDVGCGPGTAAYAFLETFPHVAKKTHIVLIDANDKMLKKADKILKFNKKTILKRNIYKDKIFENDLGDLAPDIICMPNMIGEIEEIDSQKFNELLFQKFGNLLNENGLWLVVEPALKDLSRGLLSLRDQMLDRFKILYPCTHAMNCPAYKIQDQWCHMGFKWKRPEWIRLFDSYVGFDKSELFYSPIALQKGQGSKNSDYRIVSDVSMKKWGGEVHVCGNGNLLKVTVDRNVGRKLQRGDIVKEEVFKATMKLDK